MPSTTSHRRSATRISPDLKDDEVETTPPWEDEDDEEDETPAPRRRSRKAPVADEEDGSEEAVGAETQVPFRRGRKAIAEARQANSGNTLYFRWDLLPEGEDQVVKFLDVDPWNYDSHWITRKGRQSFPCIGKGCPLCSIGNRPSQKTVYPLVNLSHPQGPLVQILEVSTSVDDQLVNLDGGKTGPLPRLYWALNRTPKPNPTGYAKWNYNFLPVKERDLEEDYDISLDLVEEALQSATEPDPAKVLGTVDTKFLQEVADEAVTS